MLRVVITAGEASGDLLGAGLMQSLREQRGDIVFSGVPGPRMRALGCQPVFNAEQIAVMGLFEILGRLPELVRLRRRLREHLERSRPDVYIGIDAPDFNLPVEAGAHDQGIRTVHYVSPSVWAWRPKRAEALRGRLDLMLTLFPFEAEFYRRNRIPVEFVGHPLADELVPARSTAATRAALGMAVDRPLLALLPGSRAGELRRLAPLFAEAARRCRAERADLQCVVAAVDDQAVAAMRDSLKLGRNERGLHMVADRTREVLQAADVALVASGTATLEAALLACPMVMAYRLSPLTYHVVRSLRLVKLRDFALPNLLAGERVVPEFLQGAAQPQVLSEALLALLRGEGRQRQLEAFEHIRQALRQGASERAARAVLALAAKQVK